MIAHDDLTVSEQEFLKLTSQEGIILVDFYATWCGPCKAMAPSLSALSQEYAGKLKVCKVDIEKAPGLAQQFSITGVPTLFILKNGSPVTKHVGAMNLASLKKFVEPQL
jgi:thioredoxin